MCPLCRGIKNCNLSFRTKSSGLAKCVLVAPCRGSFSPMFRLLSIVSPMQGAGDMNSGAIFDCRCLRAQLFPTRKLCGQLRVQGLRTRVQFGSRAEHQATHVKPFAHLFASHSSFLPRATNLTLLGGFVSYGGVVWARDSSPIFTSCTFLNSSSQLGGAVLCDGGCRYRSGPARCLFSSDVKYW
jgi:hypothetical protein